MRKEMELDQGRDLLEEAVSDRALVEVLKYTKKLTTCSVKKKIYRTSMKTLVINQRTDNRGIEK